MIPPRGRSLLRALGDPAVDLTPGSDGGTRFEITGIEFVDGEEGDWDGSVAGQSGPRPSY